MSFQKEIFLTGEYLQYFRPEDNINPFRKIYKQKKEDAIGLINVSETLKTILDVGGGMGRLSLTLAKSPGNKVFLTDVSMDMLKLAVKSAEGLNCLEIVTADAHNLPFTDNYFEYVIGLDLFCHLESPKTALGEFHRVLKSDGVLILDSTNSNPLWTIFYPRYLGRNPLNWIRIMKLRGVYPGWESIVRHYPKKKFLSLLHETGFKVIQSLNYGPAICPKWHLAVSRKIT